MTRGARGGGVEPRQNPALPKEAAAGAPQPPCFCGDFQAAAAARAAHAESPAGARAGERSWREGPHSILKLRTRTQGGGHRECAGGGGGGGTGEEQNEEMAERPAEGRGAHAAATCSKRAPSLSALAALPKLSADEEPRGRERAGECRNASIPPWAEISQAVELQLSALTRAHSLTSPGPATAPGP